MKRFLILLLCLSLLLPIFGCSQQEKAPEKPVNYYYRRASIDYKNESGVIGAEQRESLGHEGQVRYLLSEYLKGPKSSEFSQIFPADLTILSIHYADTRAKITFSFQLAQLTGIDLTIACACITMTVIELTGAESVQIFAAGALLDEYQSITMDKNCLLLLDESAQGK